MSGHETPALGELRLKVELIDREIVALLARRVSLARDVGVHKRKAGLPILDAQREAAVLRRAGEFAREAGLSTASEEEVRQLFWHIIGLCRHAQEATP